MYRYAGHLLQYLLGTAQIGAKPVGSEGIDTPVHVAMRGDFVTSRKDTPYHGWTTLGQPANDEECSAMVTIGERGEEQLNADIDPTGKRFP